MTSPATIVSTGSAVSAHKFGAKVRGGTLAEVWLALRATETVRRDNRATGAAVAADRR
jgi:hypothetical protein